MKRNFLILFLVITLSVVGYWGFKTNRILAQWELQAENQYRNAFQELNTHLNSLEGELATALVTKSNERRLVKLNNIWRDAFAAQEDLGELPIAGASLVELKNLLAKLETYTYRLSQENINQNLSSKDWDTLNQLHKQVKVTATDLENVHNKIEKEKFRWSKQRHIILEEKDLDSNSILSSLQILDKKLNLTQGDLKLTQKSVDDFLLQLGKVKEEKIEDNEAIDIAQNFLGARSRNFNFKLAENQVESKNIITVAADSGDLNKHQIIFDISRIQGEVIWFLENRDYDDPEIDSNQVKKFAQDFVNQNNYDDLVITGVDMTRDIGTVNLVPKMKNVLIYPQEVRVKVALDNGDIIGFNGRQLLSNRNIAINLKPELSLEEAKKRVNQRLDLKKNNLVVIRNDRGKNVLSYEFIGQLKKDQYKIYINAETGREEKVIKFS
ncbi:PepSY1/2 domain-containing protein [Selenihalanaerobacter shriftii]|uniref:Spore germination protein n=1 Tax=Selenihalanaerobacter shriftii TaxID=142842 RepID=A0A1T4PSK1_9FIRM|nr:PepSY1/2 domain-containing protein [Selenihalanaerobacter shriftii]SJZ94532.1 spore germination protein [Selenihalanaerobacter shriftii]